MGVFTYLHLSAFFHTVNLSLLLTYRPTFFLFSILDPLLKLLDDAERQILSDLTDKLKESGNSAINECEVLRLFGSITPLFNVTESCSQASWSYIMNMVYLPGTNLQCKSIKNNANG